MFPWVFFSQDENQLKSNGLYRGNLNSLEKKNMDPKIYIPKNTG
jgi:hypothetical protein